ncbi:MAG TPA: hypothetical protein VIL92_06350 [Gaiellaceae bacterium]
MNETPTAAPTAVEGSVPQKKPAEPRTAEYVVFTQAGDKDTWKTIDTVSAKNPDDAIEIAVAKLAENLQAGKYVAVAKARWNPGVIEPKVERSLVLRRVK